MALAGAEGYRQHLPQPESAKAQKEEALSKENEEIANELLDMAGQPQNVPDTRNIYTLTEQERALLKGVAKKLLENSI